MEDRVDSIFKEASELHEKLSILTPVITKTAGVMIECIKKSGKIVEKMFTVLTNTLQQLFRVIAGIRTQSGCFIDR